MVLSRIGLGIIILQFYLMRGEAVKVIEWHLRP